MYLNFHFFDGIRVIQLYSYGKNTEFDKSIRYRETFAIPYHIWQRITVDHEQTNHNYGYKLIHALKHYISQQNSTLKLLLPYLIYYLCTGCQWCR